MQTDARLLNIHAFFAPTGFAYTSPSSGTVGRDTKPPVDAVDGTPLAAWFDLGIIASATDNISAAGIIEVKKVINGRKMLWKELPHGLMKQITLTCQELHALSEQLLEGSLDLSRATGATAIQFNELEGDILVEGWLKTQLVDSTGTVYKVKDSYGALRQEGDRTHNGETIDYTLLFKTWYSQYNTGVILPA